MSEPANIEEKLMVHNTFGMVKVTDVDVHITISAITRDKKPINRVVHQEFDKPLNLLRSDEKLTALFAAFIVQGQPTRIAYHDISLQDEPRVGEIPEVGKAIAQAIDLVRKAFVS